jgi:hypothetical protein
MRPLRKANNYAFVLQMLHSGKTTSYGALQIPCPNPDYAIISLGYGKSQQLRIIHMDVWFHTNNSGET